MAAKIFVAICAFVFINAAHSQLVRGGIPPNLVPISETIIPNQLLFNPNLYPAAPNLINYEIPFGLPPQITVPATTTVIQDSTVANNLANALQLLIVSNLLSNTLPYMGNDVIVPGYGAPLALPGYGYVL